jgi:hypothetical protein
MDQMGVGEMGIVEDAIDGVWKQVEETHVWKHMFTQIYGGQLFVEHDGSSRYTAKINNDNHYSDYFIKSTHTSIDMRASC